MYGLLEKGYGMQKVNILGLELNDHTNKESAEMAQWFLNNGTLDVILYVDNTVLTQAGNDAELCRWIESAGLTQWASLDILEAAGVIGNGRRREVENREFLRELLHMAERDHKTVFILADSDDKTEYLRKTLRQLQPDLMIAGSAIAGDNDEDIKNDINEINSVTPAIVIAMMDFRRQLEWLHGSDNMVNAAVWLGMPSDMQIILRKQNFLSGIRSDLGRLFFSHRVHRYSRRK